MAAIALKTPTAKQLKASSRIGRGTEIIEKLLRSNLRANILSTAAGKKTLERQSD